jgi:hypothetical protein
MEPTEQQIEVFKAVWAYADHQGDTGNRVRRALAAVLHESTADAEEQARRMRRLRAALDAGDEGMDEGEVTTEVAAPWLDELCNAARGVLS